MGFVETVLFTRKLSSYLSDDEYRELQHYLQQQPDAGDIIKGSGGVRKVRWKAQGKVKVAESGLSTTLHVQQPVF